MFVLENFTYDFSFNNDKIMILLYILIRVIGMCVCVTHCVTSDSLNGQSSQPTRTFLPRERTLVAGAPFWKNYQQLEELSHFSRESMDTPRSPVVKKSEGTKLAKTSSCFTDPSSATIGKNETVKNVLLHDTTHQKPPKDLRLPHLKP